MDRYLQACVILAVAGSLLAEAPDALTSKYSFVCKENGDLEFIGMNDTFSAIRMLYYNGSEHKGQNCSKPIGSSKQTFIVQNGCGNKTNEDVTFYMKIWDGTWSNENGYTTTLAPKPPKTTLFIGGKYQQLRIVCKGIPDKGLSETAIDHFHETEFNSEIPFLQKEIKQVGMFFKKYDENERDNAYNQEISSVFIGEPFFLYLRYPTPNRNNYQVLPINCTAFDGDYASGNPLTLFNLNTTECIAAPVKEVISYFQLKGTGIVSTKLHGFRFAKGIDVTISCTVRICKTYTDCSQNLVGNVQKCVKGSQGNRRRRRGLYTGEYKVTAVQRKLKVFDTQTVFELENGTSKLEALVIPYIAVSLIALSWC